jgi:hypothetical protein
MPFVAPRRYLGPVIVLALVALSGCGSSAQQSTGGKQAAARRAQERRVLALRKQKIVAEASDLTPHTSCKEWLLASKPARETYLGKKWPYLHSEQVDLVVRAQSLGCVAAPGPARTPMAPLQAAVDIVVLGFEDFYEGTLAEGVKENAESFFGKVLGVFHMTPGRTRADSNRPGAKH